jgi:formylglycine-generating enzyme required for sulfatase activity
MKTISILMAFLLFPFTGLYANNIRVDSVSLTDQNPGEHWCNVKFNISWENSWRTSGIPYNWDAAWIFIKYKVAGDLWHHATLDTMISSHLAPSGSAIKPSKDGTGAFIYRSQDGNGNNDWTNVKIRWDYGLNDIADDATLEVKVFATEMVYIPQGSFYLGDGNGMQESEAAFHKGTSDSAIQITTALVRNIHAGAGISNDDLSWGYGIGIDGDDGLDINNDGVIENPDFPTGYKAFYIMKYEISQEQYKEFLNLLTRYQQGFKSQSYILTGGSVGSRFVLTNGSHVQNRNGISCAPSIPYPDTAVVFYNDYDEDGVFDEPNDGQNIACNFLSWPDAAAFADWAALRPMTEAEFEKACRGLNKPVVGEYAWGNTTLFSSYYSLSALGSDSELVSNPAINTGNSNYILSNNGLQDPYRCGIFAASSPDHTRPESGASYYGVMEMSGNLFELTVHMGSTAGRSYRGHHGDGELDTVGSANVDYWPGINGNDNYDVANTAWEGVHGVYNGGAGAGYRGGSMGSQTNTMKISGRGAASGPVTNHQTWTSPGRFVRDEP